MATRIWKAKINPWKIAGIKPPKNKTEKTEILNDVADLVKEQVLKDIGNGRSPVTGRAFKGLSTAYSKQKAGRARVMPNLELSGRMLDALTVRVKGDGLEYYVSGSDQQGKVDGHNNFTGKSKIPTRKFIPDTDESLREGILKKIIQLVDGDE